MYKCNLKCRYKYINVKKRPKKYTKDFGKNFDKTSKPLIEKHENYSTFMYKCILRYRCIKCEKTLKIRKQNIDKNFDKTSMKTSKKL